MGAVLLLGLMTTAFSVREMSVDEVIAAHMATVQSIQSLRLRFDQYDNRADGGTYLDEIKLRATCDYSRIGEDEFLRVYLPNERLYKDGPMGNFVETENGPRGWRSMRGYNPDDPPQLSAVKNWPVNGSMGARKKTRNYLTKEPLVDFHVQFLNHEGPERLPQFLADFVRLSKGVKLIASPSKSQFKCYELFLRNGDFEITLFLSPTYGFAVSRIEARSLSKGRRTVSELTDFVQATPGIWWPRQRHLVSDNLRSECKVSRVECNASSREAAPRVLFPEWTPVINVSTGEVYVWDTGDAPKHTFKSYADYQAWQGQQHLSQGHQLVQAQAEASAATAWPWWVWVGGGAAILLLSFLIQRRVRQAG